MWKVYRPGVPAGSTIRKQGVNFFSGMNERGRTAGKPFSLAWSLLHEPPAFLLYTTLRGVQNHELAALLKLGIAKDHILALVVVVDVFGGRLVGMHPLGRGTGGQCQYSNGEHAHRTHEVPLLDCSGGTLNRPTIAVKPLQPFLRAVEDQCQSV